MNCKQCASPIDIKSALETTPYSWPYLECIWHICPKCATGNHIRFETDSVSIIEITGAPGPTWEYFTKEIIPGIKVSWEPKYLHVWIDGIESAIPAKT